MKNARTRITRSSVNACFDLAPPRTTRAIMQLPCEIAETLRKWVDREGLPQAQVAKRLGVVQPRISEITRNKVDMLSLD